MLAIDLNGYPEHIKSMNTNGENTSKENDNSEPHHKSVKSFTYPKPQQCQISSNPDDIPNSSGIYVLRPCKVFYTTKRDQIPSPPNPDN